MTPLPLFTPEMFSLSALLGAASALPPQPANTAPKAGSGQGLDFAGLLDAAAEVAPVSASPRMFPSVLADEPETPLPESAVPIPPSAKRPLEPQPAKVSLPPAMPVLPSGKNLPESGQDLPIPLHHKAQPAVAAVPLRIGPAKGDLTGNLHLFEPPFAGATIRPQPVETLHQPKAAMLNEGLASVPEPSPVMADVPEAPDAVPPLTITAEEPAQSLHPASVSDQEAGPFPVPSVATSPDPAPDLNPEPAPDPGLMLPAPAVEALPQAALPFVVPALQSPAPAATAPSGPQRRTATAPAIASPPVPAAQRVLATPDAAEDPASPAFAPTPLAPAAHDLATPDPSGPVGVPSTPPPAMPLAANQPVPVSAVHERAPDQPPLAPQLETAIAQVGSLREALRAARPEISVPHGEFGMVSVLLEAAAPDQWRAVLASRDPGFVPAIQAALSERAIAPAGDASANFMGNNSATQNGTGDQRYGASPNGGQAGSQAYLGQSGPRDGEAAPDHRRPSTAAAIAARIGEEEASRSHVATASGGLFA